ncbi:hypothetical protein [Streptomyces sp. NPDC007856]|uniref:hypothetical protein n=1 Tax=Streptomyces sp. NPDC007856 TaxID=3364781 RepID=UPI00367F3E83
MPSLRKGECDHVVHCVRQVPVTVRPADGRGMGAGQEPIDLHLGFDLRNQLVDTLAAQVVEGVAAVGTGRVQQFVKGVRPRGEEVRLDLLVALQEIVDLRDPRCPADMEEGRVLGVQAEALRVEEIGIRRLASGRGSRPLVDGVVTTRTRQMRPLGFPQGGTGIRGVCVGERLPVVRCPGVAFSGSSGGLGHGLSGPVVKPDSLGSGVGRGTSHVHGRLRETRLDGVRAGLGPWARGAWPECPERPAELHRHFPRPIAAAGQDQLPRDSGDDVLTQPGVGRLVLPETMGCRPHMPVIHNRARPVQQFSATGPCFTGQCLTCLVEDLLMVCAHLLVDRRLGRCASCTPGGLVVLKRCRPGR